MVLFVYEISNVLSIDDAIATAVDKFKQIDEVELFALEELLSQFL